MVWIGNTRQTGASTHSSSRERLSLEAVYHDLNNREQLLGLPIAHIDAQKISVRSQVAPRNQPATTASTQPAPARGAAALRCTQADQKRQSECRRACCTSMRHAHTYLNVALF